MTTSAGPKCRGKIVALEGPTEIISTQLQLLPTSPDILVLPSIEHYLPETENEPASNTKQLIYRVHLAAKARHTEAVAFLQQAAIDKKRVVFMDGGTVGARALCLSAISRGQGDNDLDDAKSTFDKLVSDGVAGLMDDKRTTGASVATSFGAERAYLRGTMSGMMEGKKSRERTHVTSSLNSNDEPEDNDDPIVRAMRAADALDRETEVLLSPTEGVDQSARRLNNTKLWSRSSLDLPVANKRGRQTPNPPIAHRSTAPGYREPLSSISSDRSLLTSVEDLLARRMEALATISEGSLETDIPSSLIGWSNEEKGTEPVSLLSEMHGSLPVSPSAPSSPDSVTLHDTLPLEMPSSPDSAASPRSIQPASRFGHDVAQPTPLKPLQRKRPPMLQLNNINHFKRRPVPSREEPMSGSPPKDDLKSLPVSIFNKSAQPSPVLNNFQATLTETKYPNKYVDKATDTADLDQKTVQKQSFEEVLPLVENLVIHLSGDTPYPAFERIFQALRNRKHSKSVSEAATETFRGSGSTAVAGPYTEALFSDPFAPHGTNGQMLMHAALGQPAQGRLPTPPYDLSSPITPKPGPDQRFQSLSIRKQPDATIQNTLRLMLSSYIPSDVLTQHRQTHRRRSSSFSEAGTAWKPILWSDKPRSTWEPAKQLDMILAIGAERSVRKRYTKDLIKRLEKLGCDATGTSRSGHVELRWLIATAMQSFTRQPLTSQAHDNPFTNRTLLANLLLAPLQSFLSLRPPLRLLILEYPVDHLPTVLALRSLIGQDKFKIGAVLGSDISHSVSPKSAPSQFSRADYILPSSALPSEITGFVDSIRNDLLANSRPDSSPAITDSTPSIPTSTSHSTSITSITQSPNSASRSGSFVRRFRPLAFLSISSVDTPPQSPAPSASVEIEGGDWRTAPQSPVSMNAASGVRGMDMRGGAMSVSGSSVAVDGDKAVRGVLLVGSGASVVSEGEMEYEDEVRRFMPGYLKRKEGGGNGKALRLLGVGV
ncbi:hypothetical protein OQA88_12342 [Cercophora sp. LCS_1]